MSDLIFLYGPPASGKTTLARKLAASLSWEFVDLDEAIVSCSGRSIPEIFAIDGEAAFRQLESATLRQVVDSRIGSPKQAAVIALGGGTLLDHGNREYCEKHGTVLCLDSPPADELARRIKLEAESRPLGDKAAERAAHYATFPFRIADNFESEKSLVIVGTGIAGPILATGNLVVDAQVAQLYANRMAKVISVIPSGESHKTPATVLKLWHDFAAAGLGRQDRVVALGGGVTGDLTGFAAATWMRGIDWINVPTTLLSMVDASTGGKTGFDLPEGKNLAGAFHSPRLVVIDTLFLATLSPELIAAGRAEMIKHQIISGNRPQISGDRPQNTSPNAAEIAKNLRIKVEIVRADPLERLGRRILLNCGHTVAHAVEKLSDYQIAHGAAVAIGCVAEARLAVALKLADKSWPEELAKVFAAAGLPTELPAGMNGARLAPIMLQDKKRCGNSVAFALPCGWGKIRVESVEVTTDNFDCLC